MLDPDEKSAFDGLVTQLRGDSAFASRIDRIAHPRRRPRQAIAVVLWIIAPFCVVIGGWTGFLIAVVAAGYAGYLLSKRTSLADGVGFRWSLPRRRPGASI